MKAPGYTRVVGLCTFLQILSPEIPPDTKKILREEPEESVIVVQTCRRGKAVVQKGHEILPGSFFQSLL